MENINDVLELLDILYAMVNEAWGVPLGNDKCIIEREKAIDIINDIKSSLPTSIAESKRLVSARDEFIGNAKRQAESLRKSAEEQAALLIDQQEITKAARKKSAEMITNAEKRSNELKRVASEYVDDMMRKCEESLNEALTTVRNTQASLRTSGASESKPVAVEHVDVKAKEAESKAEKKVTDIPLDFEEDSWGQK